jgi:hypothetical protein
VRTVKMDEIWINDFNRNYNAKVESGDTKVELF